MHNPGRRELSADEVIALASSKSPAQVYFGEDQVQVADLDSYDFTGTDIALFSAGGVAEKYAEPPPPAVW